MKGARITYSPAEMRWLEANRAMVISDYHAAFCAEFGRSDVSASNLHGLRKRKRWLVGRTPGRFVGRHRLFSATEIGWLRDNCTLPIRGYHKAFCETFSRTDQTAEKLYALRKRKRWKTGRTGHFAQGSVPWSKGKKIGNNPGSARAQFKKGQKPHNAKSPGYEHVRTDGYVEIAVEQTNPYTGYPRRMAIKHRLLWVQQHGPVPEGMVLKCKGDPANADPSNWELVPIGLLPRLNGRFGRGYDAAPDELKPTIMAVAKLAHQVRAKRAAS